MNRSVTSKEEILKVSRELLLEGGFSGLSMRAVAEQCGVAVGSLYNYFPSKSDLVSAVVGGIWEEILAPLRKRQEIPGFLEYVSGMFETIRNGNAGYPGFFSIHSLHFASEEKALGRQLMNDCFLSLKNEMLQILKEDGRVRRDVFGDSLSMETFVDYMFTLLISLLLRGETDCKALLILIQNSIY